MAVVWGGSVLSLASTGTNGELSLFASTDKSTYRIGEPIVYIILVRNESQTSLLVNTRLLVNYDQTFPHEILLDVTGPDGIERKLVPIITAAEPVENDFSILEAGSFFLKELYLNPLFDLAMPGAYSIEATYENHFVPEGLSPWTGVLYSNPVTITLTE